MVDCVLLASQYMTSEEKRLELSYKESCDCSEVSSLGRPFYRSATATGYVQWPTVTSRDGRTMRPLD